MSNLLPLGESHIDPTLVASITVDQTSFCTPAPGNTMRPGGALTAMHVAMAFDHASPIYRGYGYEDAADAFAATEEFIHLSGQDMVRVSATKWVSRRFVGAVTFVESFVDSDRDHHYGHVQV